MSSIRQKISVVRQRRASSGGRVMELESRIAFLEREKEKALEENMRLQLRIGELELALHEALNANRQIFRGNEPLVS